MKRIVISLSVIAVIAAVAIGGTTAFFSDTETSSGNTFTAGAIDLTIDSQQHYNGNECIGGSWVGDAPYPEAGTDCAGAWELTDLGPTHKLFDYGDVKPGDSGENTISLHVDNNDAYACVTINPTLNDDMSSTEPELDVDVENTDSIFDGELAQNMNFRIWADVCDDLELADPGDNIYQPNCDALLTEGDGPITPVTWTLADPSGNVFNGVGPLVSTETYYLGAEWSIPSAVGNIIQTDKYMADISFYVEQARNNENFVCPSIVTPEESHSLRLENEVIVADGPWTIIEDGTFADLVWAGDGLTFDYDLTAQGLATSTQYSLIYYADGWPGDNPGAFIGTHTSDGSGVISDLNNIVDLGLDLPDPADGNYAVGAKIWLVLASDYNSGSAATGPMTAWNPDSYLFEGNVYITYDDLDV